MKSLRLISIFILAIATLSAHAKSLPQETDANFQIWLEGFKQQAQQSGISKATLELAFKDVSLNHKVLESDRRQPEFTSTFFQYFYRAVSRGRIIKGTENYEKYGDLLNEVTQKYGIPGRIIVAFWGMETNYGRFTGSTPIIESLATLSFDPRRSAFFTKQLLNALEIIDQGHVHPRQMKGSWAGAMGQVQFMPYNYLKYAVDGDGDGKINLWDSLPDAFHSAGNFLKELGWKTGETWGREVMLPRGFDYALADGKTERKLQEWAGLGIKQANGRPLPTSETILAKLILPSDYRGPAFIVYSNFQVIKRWNNSNNYALAVGNLADRIIGKAPLTKKQPRDDKSLTREQMTQMQNRLNQLGYSAGAADGVAGSRTRDALRQFQVKQKQPADGAPTYRMLEMLNSVKQQ
ncbi:MAG: membrane-bound lytic murein transglycosylase B [Thiomicrorhabdus sp.]|nr:MAG: membrane-bound lytic murein transglycosylase B [Thiomicrorhabdus sp.]